MFAIEIVKIAGSTVLLRPRPQYFMYFLEPLGDGNFLGAGIATFPALDALVGTLFFPEAGGPAVTVPSRPEVIPD